MRTATVQRQHKELRALALLARSAGPMTAGEVAAEFGWSRSLTRSMMLALVAAGRALRVDGGGWTRYAAVRRVGDTVRWAQVIDARTRAGVTVDALAIETGIRRAAVVAILARMRPPTTEELDALERALGLDGMGGAHHAG